MLIQLPPDRLQHTDYIADRAIRVFYPHIDDTAVVWNPVKPGMDLYTSFAEFLPEIPGESYISPAIVCSLMQDRVIFISLSITHRSTFPVIYPACFIRRQSSQARSEPISEPISLTPGSLVNRKV